MLRITLSKAGEAPRSANFDKREITVGRTSNNDVVIPEPGVSSSHARILFTGAEITIIDLESTNGTFVNGGRIQGPHILSPRDEVFICAHRIDFEMVGVQPAGRPGTGAHPAAGIDPSPRPYTPSALPGFTPQSFAGPPPMPGPIPAPIAPPMGPGPTGVAPMEPEPLGPPMAPAALGQMPAAVSVSPGFDPNRFAIPSPVGGGGPRPPEDPTMPPPLAPIGFEAAMPELPPAVAPPPDLPPPALVSTPIPPPVILQPPARTGATVTPANGGVAEPPPPVGPDTREPPASLDPIAHPGPSWQPPAPIASSGLDGVGAPSVMMSPPAPISIPPPPPDPPPPAMPPVSLAPAERPLDPPFSNPAALDHSERRAEPAASPRNPEPIIEAVDPEPWVSEEVPTATPNPQPGARSRVPIAVAPPALAVAGARTPEPRAEVGFRVDDLAGVAGPTAEATALTRVFASVFAKLTDGDELPGRDADTRAHARAEAVRLLSLAAQTVPNLQVRPVAERIASEICGLGALTARLAEPDVQEIFVHGPDRVQVRRGSGVAAEIDARFTCRQAIEVVVRRLTQTPFGADNPVVDARTLDGADVYAVHESIATDGPVVTISLPSPSTPRFTLESLLASAALSPGIANLLTLCVQAGVTILICGAPGTRSFPLLAALIDAAPATDRHVLVRPMSESGKLPAHVVVLEGDGLVGTDDVSVMQALVRTAVGLRPDRLTVHEIGGPEAADVLASGSRGLAGMLLSTRAPTANDALARLAALAGLAGSHSDAATRAAAFAHAIELVVTVARLADGRTRVIEVAQLGVDTMGRAGAIEIIRYEPKTGTWRHTGVTPALFETLQRRGIAVDTGMLAG